MLRFSLFIPKTSRIGLLTTTEEEPVNANTIKMRINSHLCWTSHFNFSFLNIHKVIANNKINTKTEDVRKSRKLENWNRREIFTAEKTSTNNPSTGYTSCQFLVISQLSLKLFIAVFTAAKIS